MKRIALLLAALLMFSLTGCGSSEAAGEASDSDKAGAYEVIPPEDGRGDLIPASSDVVSIPVLVGGGLPFIRFSMLVKGRPPPTSTGMLTTSEEAGIRSPRPSSGGMTS